MTSLRRLWPALAAVVLLLLAAQTAVGHAELDESNPAEGSTVTTPLKGSLTFDDELKPDAAASFVSIVDADDAEVARGEVSETDETRIDVQLPELPPGIYTARWQATSADDDFVSRGDFTFTVAGATATGAPTAAPTSGPSGGGNENGAETPAGNDLTLALIIAALAIAAVLAFVFLRMRRR
jgi:methionine-rich copper-binding protein CopC